jgi:hypothetical protein
MVMERKMLLGIAAVSMRARNPVHQAPEQLPLGGGIRLSVCMCIRAILDD